jgi:malate synthase
MPLRLKSRSQLWQWLQSDFRQWKKLNESYYHRLAMEEFEKIRNLVGDENEKQKIQTGRTIIGRACCKLTPLSNF